MFIKYNIIHQIHSVVVPLHASHTELRVCEREHWSRIESCLPKSHLMTKLFENSARYSASNRMYDNTAEHLEVCHPPPFNSRSQTEHHHSHRRHIRSSTSPKLQNLTWCGCHFGIWLVVEWCCNAVLWAQGIHTHTPYRSCVEQGLWAYIGNLS